MRRVLAFILGLLFASATISAISQPLGSADDFIARVNAGAIDLATFDFAAAGFWELPANDRYAWVGKTNSALAGSAFFVACNPKLRKQWQNGMWIIVLTQSRNATSWSENVTALRKQLHVLDLAIYDAIGATGVTPSSSRTERLRRRLAGDRVIRDEQLDARLVAELPRPAVRYWAGLKDTRRFEVDCANMDWLEAEVKKDGWFDIPRYGKQADADAWQIIEHSVRNFHSQRDLLALLEALAPGATNATKLAELHDEVAVNSNRPQRYGTAGSCYYRGGWFLDPLEDPAGVDARRASVGLGPLADFERESKAKCDRINHPPVRARPSPRT